MLYNIKAEKFVLISMIQEHEIIDEVIMQLKVNDLYSKEHQRLYEIILKLYDENKVFDLLLLEQYGCSKKLLDEMVKEVSQAKHIYKYDYTAYLKVVLELSLRRRIISAAKEIQHIACKSELTNDLETFKADCMEKLDVKIFESPYSNSKIGVKEVEDVLDIIEDRCSRDDSNLNKYGYKWLDTATAGTHKGEVTILAARPGTGKTAFSLNIALNKILEGVHVRIFSLEMSKESLLERMLINLADVDGMKLRAGKTSPEDFENLEKAKEILSNKNLYIDNNHSFEEMRSICRRAKNKFQLDYLIIDYLQLMETENFQQGSTNDKLEYLSRRIKLMACEMDIPILLLSQLNRATEVRNDKIPQLSDLRGSGAIEQDADNIFFLCCMSNDISEPPFDNEKFIDVVITVAKQRNGIAGKNNVLRFFKANQRFKEINWD